MTTEDNEKIQSTVPANRAEEGTYYSDHLRWRKLSLQ